jgi:hypothetical protein
LLGITLVLLHVTLISRIAILSLRVICQYIRITIIEIAVNIAILSFHLIEIAIKAHISLRTDARDNIVIAINTKSEGGSIKFNLVRIAIQGNIESRATDDNLIVVSHDVESSLLIFILDEPAVIKNIHAI